MNRKLLIRIAALCAFLQWLSLVPGLVAPASAGWTYLGYFWTGTSWGHLVVQYKFTCATQSHGTYEYYSKYNNYPQAAAEATKRCK
jgi:hypothetical protein